jgi:hypothetical protein
VIRDVVFINRRGPGEGLLRNTEWGVDLRFLQVFGIHKNWVERPDPIT